MNAANGTVVDFNVANANTDSFKIKEKITVQTVDHDTKNVGILVPLK